jgi:hypothetical protein
MTNGARLSSDGRSLTVRLPMAFARRGGRKLVISPEKAESGIPMRTRVDNAIIKAIARGFRWRRLLETGAHASFEELACAEKINPSYVSRVVRLTLLAPSIVEAILDGRQSPGMKLGDLMKPFPVAWAEQEPIQIMGHLNG